MESTVVPKTKGKRGGARPGAGRKPKAANLLEQRLITQACTPLADGKASAAEYAFALLDQVQRGYVKMVDPDDPTKVVTQFADISLRVTAAEKVLNRVLGKPHQAVEVSGRDGKPIQVVVRYADRPIPRSDDHPTQPTPESGAGAG